MKLTSLAIGALVHAATAFSAQAGDWSYDSYKDEMRGTVTKRATVRSENTLDFAFPYQAVGNYASLTLFKGHSDWLNIGLAVDTGQFVCTQSIGGLVYLKFDDGEVETAWCSDSSDGKTNVVWMLPGFMENWLPKSRRLIIEALFYGSGRKQMVFDVAGLNW